MKDDRTLSSPYRSMALAYLDTGLGSPIPSAWPLEKRPPLEGWTGKAGKRPEASQVTLWQDSHPDSNILLRLDPDVVGIDVDGYGSKRGAETFIEVSSVHGALPPTWRSNARHDDAISGIRFLRLTQDMEQSKSKGDFGPRSDIEIIRANHRFAAVYPSWHAGVRARYRWYGLDGVMVDEWVLPSADDLPLLPTSWCSHLTQRCDCFARLRHEAKEQTKRYRGRLKGADGWIEATGDLLNGLDTLAEMPEGSRNTFLSKLAGRTYLYDVLGAMALRYEDVTGMLWEAARACELDDDEIARTLESADEWAGKVVES